jgi:hypothetical protein
MSEHPVLVIGAGPTGLSAAAHARSRGLDVLVLEAGRSAGSAVSEWGHVRLFSPWSQLVDPVGATLLEATGWQRPQPTGYPTGADWVRAYLRPLADLFGSSVRYGHRVTGVARQGRDRLVDAGRSDAPFVVHVQTPAGEERIAVRAVVDSSGTWRTPNPLGGDGLPALGEASHAARISYRVPDLRDADVRGRFAGRHVVVAGTGASAMNVLVELAALAEQQPQTRVSWLVRRGSLGDAFGGGEADQLVARGALGQRARAAVNAGAVRILTGFRTSAVQRADGGLLQLESLDGQVVTGVDEVVAVTGFRPDLSWLSEVRLDLDPVLDAPRALAPLIDPNVHSCGTVPPHGAAELAQPDQGFYLAGMKSYGRATSFLALTGFEQVRSVVAAIAGDAVAATQVELTLPETGVCGGAGLVDETAADGGGCCGASQVTDVLTLSGRR